ncbi:MAG: type II secretion system protein GspM [Parasphingorhabdus sp.]|nr:type II secretion system protein GspM [Parasphingorhabdus sp.]
MTALRDWFSGLSGREKWLIGTAVALTLLILGWFAVIVPLSNGLTDARNRYDAAVIRNGSIAAKVDLLKNKDSAERRVSDLPINIIVAQSAGETGFTLDRSEPAGEGQLGIAISAARSTSLLKWLSDLEAQGINVREIAVRPGANGTVAVTATLVKLQ